MQRPSLGWWATVIAGIALIAGVWFFYNPGQDDGGGSSADRSDESSEPTDSTPKQPAAPEMPAAAKQNNAAGAEAFARYHFTLYNYAQQYNDSTKLKTLYSDRCDPCLASLATIDERKENGHRVIGGEWKVQSVRAAAVESSFLETLTLERNAVKELTKDGETAVPLKDAGVRTIELQVQWMEDSWKVVSITS